jgi:hypothetical protein
MIEKREQLLKQGKDLVEEANELSGALDIDDFPDTMTLAKFKAEVKVREEKRHAILAKMDEVGQEGQGLDRKINKFLFAGLPGLSQAVVDVVNNLYERASALSILQRRVTEQVQFGDSNAALSILANFEKDEVMVSDEIKSKFDAAIEALKKAGQKAPKSLKKAG